MQTITATSESTVPPLSLKDILEAQTEIKKRVSKDPIRKFIKEHGGDPEKHFLVLPEGWKSELGHLEKHKLVKFNSLTEDPLMLRSYYLDCNSIFK